ncbi:MAG: DeoR/GlpR transcriptional regulator [Clostridia bacterium]|nr:DeoR/GlpR transcriptional regulator [Clostridia bacterium]
MSEGKLKIDKRRSRILELLKQNGKVYVTELAELLGVTSVTVRYDLDALERDGYLVRMKGGAVYSNRNLDTGVSAEVEVPFVKEKEEIAVAISKMIKDGDTVFINSGTTTQLVAAELKKHNHLNIVTNSISVALTLGAIASFRLILLGGEVNVKYGFTYGGEAQEKLSRYHADWAILSVDGIGAESGITTYHAEESILDRIMIERSAQVIVAADSSKIGRVGFLRICPPSEAITLVTDGAGEEPELAALAERGVKIITA